jgi:hypothetical protein
MMNQKYYPQKQDSVLTNKFVFLYFQLNSESEMWLKKKTHWI